MSFLNDYFDRVFCINLNRSVDRWKHVAQECVTHDFKVERMRGYDFLEYTHLPPNLREPMKGPMSGCTASHRLVLGEIGLHNWDKVLVLEDDFHIVHDDFQERLREALLYVPTDWEMLYLGAHYGGPPHGRINQHVVKADYIKTTSSYAIRGPYVRFLAPMFSGDTGPDDLFSGFNKLNRVYVLQPRLMVQYANTSMISGRFTDNGQCMLDTRHEEMV